MDKIRIAGLVRESIVDGPGIRYVIFTQGCLHKCPGCHNPETHDLDGGYDVDIEDLILEIKENPLLDGISISGGEPFLQLDALGRLCKRVKALGLTSIVYTGYSFEDFFTKSGLKSEFKEAFKYIDILIDGPYIEEERDPLLNFRGSRNQRIIDLKSSFLKDRLVEVDL